MLRFLKKSAAALAPCQHSGGSFIQFIFAIGVGHVTAFCTTNASAPANGRLSTDLDKIRSTSGIHDQLAKLIGTLHQHSVKPRGVWE